MAGGYRPHLRNVSTTNNDVRATPPISTNQRSRLLRISECACALPWRRESEPGIAWHYEMANFIVFYDLSVHFSKTKNGQYTACRGHFMLSFGTRFSPLVLRVFKRCQGKVGQFNTI